ncbi:hypothetical protein ACWD6Z_27310, partial [Streptomyces californicus]
RRGSRVWESVLDLRGLPDDADFFDLGGNSLPFRKRSPVARKVTAIHRRSGRSPVRAEYVGEQECTG